jgi:ribosomal protein S25
VDTEELADEEASETKSSELHRDRDELLRNLSKSQRKIYESVIQETAYFTPERLEEKYSISLNIGQKGLQLLAAAGLIVPVTLPTPTSSGLRYELAYRNLNQDYDTGIVMMLHC